MQEKEKKSNPSCRAGEKEEKKSGPVAVKVAAIWVVSKKRGGGGEEPISKLSPRQGKCKKGKGRLPDNRNCI